MERDALRPVLADSRRYLTIFEWRLFLSGLRNRPQLWLKENGDSARSQSLLMQINADTVCLVRTQFWQINSFISSQKASLN
jgi:hypothetical protein